jgi:hypothetical protein
MYSYYFSCSVWPKYSPKFGVPSHPQFKLYAQNEKAKNFSCSYYGTQELRIFVIICSHAIKIFVHCDGSFVPKNGGSWLLQNI